MPIYLFTRPPARIVSAVRAALVFRYSTWYVVTDPIINFVCDGCTTAHCVFCYRQLHAVSVISTASREDSSRTIAVSRCFLILSWFAHATHSAVYHAALSRAVGILLLRTRTRAQNACSGPKSSDRSATPAPNHSSSSRSSRFHLSSV